MGIEWDINITKLYCIAKTKTITYIPVSRSNIQAALYKTNKLK